MIDLLQRLGRHPDREHLVRDANAALEAERKPGESAPDGMAVVMLAALWLAEQNPA